MINNISNIDNVNINFNDNNYQKFDFTRQQ